MPHKELTEPEELSYRRPLQIAEVFVPDGGDAFPVCPKCRVTFDVEYQKNCSYCVSASSGHIMPRRKL